MSTDFVEGWAISHTLGEGAYGEVKLVVNKTTGDCVAMKVIDILNGGPSLKKIVEKEVKIHKFLKDNHIIRCYGSREQSSYVYIFLEYAPHGELFDKIEPDVGMSPQSAQKFMRQLMNGVVYLHSCGITHRDLKPENLLIDKDDNLKISDFGLATIFRLNGKERALDKKCGTLPYTAPEVLVRTYAAGPADVWSCGIVLVAMLAGELPWDKASEEECIEYVYWRKGDYMQRAPWSKVETGPLALVKLILKHLPSERPTPEKILQHRWLNNTIKTASKPTGAECKRLKDDVVVVTLSQTAAPAPPEGHTPDFLSQPMSRVEDMLISTQQLMATQTTVQNSLQKLVRRMTRFCVSLSMEEAVEELTSVFEKLRLEWNINPQIPSVVTVTSVDRRKAPLVFKVTVFGVDGGVTLVDFRRSKGDGLEFKRHFLSVRSSIKPVMVRPPFPSTTSNTSSISQTYDSHNISAQTAEVLRSFDKFAKAMEATATE